MSARNDDQQTNCCIVGGGPAGMFLGYLLARSGISVIVLEKHADFLRDFRGDTIHPSTMELLAELQLLEQFLPLADFRTDTLTINFEGRSVTGPVLSHLKTPCPFIAFTPQWDFLNLLSTQARQYPGFDLRMGTMATDVLRENGRVAGVHCQTEQGEYTIRADLVVAADGRQSTIRTAAQHEIVEQGIPIDVLWFRLDRPSDDEHHTLAWLNNGHFLVTLPRRSHYQVGMVIKKGAFDAIKSMGIPEFRRTIGAICPPLQGVTTSLSDWQDVKLLTVQINRLVKWHEPGLLFIGDAAHAMSPVGGVGINLAIQDAVAAANLLAGPLRDGTLSESHLAAVQKRREKAARRTQRLQTLVHSQLFGGSKSAGRPLSLPWHLRLMLRCFGPLLRRLAGRAIGIGLQPEHIATEQLRHATSATSTDAYR